MSETHQRVLDALELREPDRVPVFDLMMEYATVYSILGRKPSPVSFLFSDPRTTRALDRLIPFLNRSPKLSQGVMEKVNQAEMAAYARDSARAAVTMGYDAAWISYYPVFQFRDSRTATDIFGRLYDVAVDKKGFLALPMYRGGLIESPADWQRLDKKPLFRLIPQANRVFTEIRKEFGDRFFIFGMLTSGIFETVWQSMGFQRFVLAVRRERETVRRMIKFYEDYFCLVIEALADAGLPGTVYSDDLAYKSGTMLSPRLIEELFGDAYRRITGTAHALGMKIIIHSCGNTTDLLPWFADCGFDGVHPLEPTAGMDLAGAKAAAGNRICLIGNLDVTHTLVDAGREEVRGEVRTAIRDAGPGGGYILAPNHNHEDVSVERLRWMVEAAHDFGGYPLNVNPASPP